MDEAERHQRQNQPVQQTPPVVGAAHIVVSIKLAMNAAATCGTIALPSVRN
jgi:hypothetical protein